MRTFPAGDRVRGLNISDCLSPLIPLLGEFPKCTEDDRECRIRMFAGCPSWAPPFFGQTRKVAKAYTVKNETFADGQDAWLFLGSSVRRCANAYPLLLLSSSLASGQRFPCGRAALCLFLSPARAGNAIRTVVATEPPGAGVRLKHFTFSPREREKGRGCLSIDGRA